MKSAGVHVLYVCSDVRVCVICIIIMCGMLCVVYIYYNIIRGGSTA